MKKLKLSVAALSIALSMNAQTPIKTTTHCEEVTFTKFEVIEILILVGDILEWQNQDIEDAEYNGREPDCGRYSEGWGSNYWLTLLENQLYTKLNGEQQVADCENCDEID